MRIEREQAGVTEVSFGRGAQNAPFVVALWRRERFIFWPAAIATAAALHFTALRWPLAYIEIPGAVGFTLGGFLSVVRAGRSAPERAITSAWWAATIACAAALAVLLR
ncbi:MAG TPA: hypothetical protein VMZ53_02270 [Kofleriaceae bacterium]|nr:hypothetical protein [Kofleriaceae bacterium]